MKKIFAAVVILLIVVMNGYALAQEDLRGTETPAVYGQKKQRILQRQERAKRSKTIQEVARAYREMVSSYKAKRIIRAEEMSQKLDVLLEDPILPEAFSNKMARKQRNFLKRIYGGKIPAKMDVPVDAVSDAEIREIQYAVKEETGKGVGLGILLQNAGINSLSHKEIKKQQAEVRKRERLLKRQRRKDEKAELKKVRYEEKAALKESHRVAALARKRKKKSERLARIEDKKNRKGQKRNASHEISDIQEVRIDLEENVKVVNEKKISSAAQTLDVLEANNRKARKIQRLRAYQQELLDLERNEIDRYVQLYQKEMENKKSILQEELSKKIDLLYQDGVEYYEKKAYYFSRDVLFEVEKLQPDYKLTRQYLAELEMHFKFKTKRITGYSLKDDSERQQVIFNSLSVYQK